MGCLGGVSLIPGGCRRPPNSRATHADHFLTLSPKKDLGDPDMKLSQFTTAQTHLEANIL